MLPWLEVVEVGGLVVLAACTIMLAVRSAPAQLERRCKAVERTCAALGSQVDETVALRATWKADLETIAGSEEDYFGRIEKKRASTAASASRIKRAEAVNDAPAPESLGRADQISWARQQLGL